MDWFSTVYHELAEFLVLCPVYFAGKQEALYGAINEGCMLDLCVYLVI